MNRNGSTWNKLAWVPSYLYAGAPKYFLGKRVWEPGIQAFLFQCSVLTLRNRPIPTVAPVLPNHPCHPLTTYMYHPQGYLSVPCRYGGVLSQSPQVHLTSIPTP
ncbi:hypothetical protein Bbelb_172410 [Branchiostoma belcheri]|nr:hypothetical protein Bbelb_172410 [Branchiostoma belcheri]